MISSSSLLLNLATSCLCSHLNNFPPFVLLLGQVCNLIVSIPDPCCLSYFVDVVLIFRVTTLCPLPIPPFESKISNSLNDFLWPCSLLISNRSMLGYAAILRTVFKCPCYMLVVTRKEFRKNMTKFTLC